MIVNGFRHAGLHVPHFRTTARLSVIHVKEEPMMGTETKPHQERVSEIFDAPSIAPHRDQTSQGSVRESYPKAKPQHQFHVSRGEAVRRRKSIMDIAKNVAGVMGLVAGLGVYLVVILSVVVASLCWMLFSRDDEASDRA
jgi:hypothetical protein